MDHGREHSRGRRIEVVTSGNEMREALIPVGFGLAIGIPRALAAAHLIENQLYL